MRHAGQIAADDGKWPTDGVPTRKRGPTNEGFVVCWCQSLARPPPPSAFSVCVTVSSLRARGVNRPEATTTNPGRGTRSRMG